MTGDRSKTAVRSLATIEGDDAEVTVRIVETPKGERLELESVAGDSIRLDAVALECLAWQDRSRFASFFGAAEGDPADHGSLVAHPHDQLTRRDLTSITNEFAHVDVRAIPGSPDLLELGAPKAGVTVCLTAPALAKVAAQRPEAITELVRQRVE